MMASTSRAASSPIGSRPNTSGEDSDPASGSKLRRKSFLPGSRSRSRGASKENSKSHEPTAWINAGEYKIDYNLSFLTNGEKVPELWDDGADTCIYLFPQASGRGPAFKVPSMTLSSSFILMSYMNSNLVASPSDIPRGRSLEGRDPLSVEDGTNKLSLRDVNTPPYTPKTSISDKKSSVGSNSDGIRDSLQSFPDGPREMHMYFPTGLTSDGSHSQLTGHDTQVLVDIRNLFAFLSGQPLVGTKTRPTNFRIFQSIGAMLQRFEFRNIDSSTFGESASASFDFYLDELRLGDGRSSREKTIEGLILGEALRSSYLYTEAFTHAVGKYSSFMNKKWPILEEISSTTRTRLERANQELAGRQHAANLHLTDFNFPSLFAGIAASTVSDESNYIRWNKWKTHSMNMRKLVLTYCRDIHGHWPPKASTKKGLTGGLNRMVLQGLYGDMCSLYDLKADREALTTRSMEASEDNQVSDVDPTSTALRKVLAEFDRSYPPPNPPIPFDVPLVPTIASVDPAYERMSPKDQVKASSRKLKSNEVTLIMSKSHNQSVNTRSPFLSTYLDFEAKEAKGKNAQELADMTYGHWIFMYAVIQSLPMLVVDVKGLRYTGGVEYFLCMPPTSMPWVEDPASALYRNQDGNVVSLPAHVVEYGPEAVYRRSHCWTVANQWITQSRDGIVETTLEQQGASPGMLSPLIPPPSFGGGEFDMGPPIGGSPGASPSFPPANHTHQRSFSGGSDSRLSTHGNDPRSRNRAAQRQSIALGLERLPIPGGHDNWSPRPGSSRGQSPGGWQSPGAPQAPHSRKGSRSRSRGMDSPADNSGATFDDILSNIGGANDNDKSKKGKKK